MNYIEYHFIIKGNLQPASDILLAELGELDFESFEETQNGLLAYIPSNLDHQQLLDEVSVLQSDEFEIDFTKKEIQQVNWNEEWEKNFHPINVDNKCVVRAPFHTTENTDYEIIIEPKMSFGTGHHATTHQMIAFILNEKIQHKKVLDMGCGTGVLGILCSKKDASAVSYIDIDEWCVENTQENLTKNNCQGEVILGGAEKISGKFDVILANINRNILLEDIPTYSNNLEKGGTILFSGFYEKDLAHIKKKAAKNKLKFVNHTTKDNWVAAKFVKAVL
ncbi:MAG: 50S ribosomal protein L11 methyltransferase [Bacteroidota bacterium]